MSLVVLFFAIILFKRSNKLSVGKVYKRKVRLILACDVGTAHTAVRGGGRKGRINEAVKYSTA